MSSVIATPAFLTLSMSTDLIPFSSILDKSLPTLSSIALSKLSTNSTSTLAILSAWDCIKRSASAFLCLTLFILFLFAVSKNFFCAAMSLGLVFFFISFFTPFFILIWLLVRIKSWGNPKAPVVSANSAAAPRLLDILSVNPEGVLSSAAIPKFTVLSIRSKVEGEICFSSVRPASSMSWPPAMPNVIPFITFSNTFDPAPPLPASFAIAKTIGSFLTLGSA